MPKDENAYIVEFIVIGKAIKVTAVDPVTDTEVSIVGAPGVTQDELSKLAIRKLRYVLEKRADG